MFRHQGKSRTFVHNLQIATVLSFVAGMVNVTGFLAIKQLTTNVTGHFALFINDVAELEYLKVIRDIRDNEPILFERIKRLPKKSRSVVKKDSPENELVTFFRKGQLKKFIHKMKN